MAKRVIQECDLTKQEYDPDQTVVLIIKKKGKKVGRTYELSPDAAAKLEQQLVAGIKLEKHWSFSNQPSFPVPRSIDPIAVIGSSATTTIPTWDETQDNDSQWVEQKKAFLKEEGIIPESGPPEQASPPGACVHMNKGPVRTTMRNGEQYAYRLCKQCGKQIAEHKREDTKAYISQTPPPDVNLKDYGEEK